VTWGYHDFAIAVLLGPNGERFVVQSGSVRFQAAHVDGRAVAALLRTRSAR
jgi:hypothetical protein